MTTEVTEENFSIEVNDQANYVEIRYQGVNATMLAVLQQQVADMQTALNAALAGVSGALGTLSNDLNSLESLTNAQGNALVDEIAERLAADTLLGSEGAATASELGDAIEAETEARGAALIAEAEARNVAIGEATASIVTDVAALTVTVSGMVADLGAAQASIIEVSEALATETAARAAQYSAIQADFGDTNAAVLSESVARADADEALALSIESIEADFTDEINAAVTVEALARASADEALGSAITVVQANVDDVSASVLVEQSARVAADGSLNARYGVKVDANGHVAGFGLNITANDDTSHSEFVINADAFKVFNGTSDVSPFFVSGGIVYMTNVQVNSLDALSASMGDLSVDGALVMSATGLIRGGKSSFSDTTNGFWIGYDSGAYKFTFGNSSSGISWNGTTLTISGQVVATQNLVAQAVTVIDEDHFSWGTSSPYDTSWGSTYAAFHPSHTGHLIDLNLGTEVGATKVVKLELMFIADRDGGDDDNVGLRFVDFTGSAFQAYVGEEARDVQLLNGFRLCFFSQTFTTTQTGTRRFTVYAKSFGDGSPFISYVQLTGQVFKK
jgi:hypothetical protein